MKTYCGVGTVPVGSERGTAEQCMKSNQIRYYGIKKVKLDSLKKVKEVAKKESIYKQEMIKYRAMEKRINNILDSRDIFHSRVLKAKKEGTENKKAQESVKNLQKEADALYKRMLKQEKKLSELKNEIEQSK